MAKFEESRHTHEVHEVHRPQGHGLQHDRTEKRGKSPIVPFLPGVSSGSEPGEDGSGAPGVPNGQYASGNSPMGQVPGTNDQF